MSPTEKFWINNVSDHGGPNIFSTRLKDELESRGKIFIKDPFLNQTHFTNLCAIAGPSFECANNVLRLDNLYFDSENPDCNRLNAPIFEAYKRFDHIIFQSEFSKKMYEAFTGIERPNSVILNGTSPGFNYNPNPRKEAVSLGRFDKICITSAAWRRHKRLEELVSVFSRPELARTCLLVLGGHEYDNIQQGDCPKNVVLLPKVHHTQLPSYYNIADAMVFISWLDCCPNSVAEALSCGVPVLCSHNGGTKELVKDDGIVLQLEDDYEFGTQIPLYNPPKIDEDILLKGVLGILEMDRGFVREDLSIKSVADKYEEAFKWA